MIEQIVIAFTGIPAIYLSQHEETNFKKYACLFGLAGQPFWFYSFFNHEQWGMVILCILYTLSWYKGFKLYWLNKNHG